MILENLKTLSQIEKTKDIVPLRKTTYPGTHCPLFGATLTLKLIKDCIVLVIGTEECTYYTKNLSNVFSEFGGINGRILSFVMDKHDVTFGCKEKIQKSVEQIVEEYNPNAIFMLTTCVPEITGEDVLSVAKSLTKKYNIPIECIHTEHFRCNSHLLGIENVLTSCANFMEEQEQTNSINILGEKSQNNELINILKENNVDINLCLPSNCSIDEIKKASKAKLNIVCSRMALNLAKKMEAKFNIPYISFVYRCNIEDIYNGYKEIFDVLNISLPKKLENIKNETNLKLENAKNILKDKTFILGISKVETFAVVNFLCSLGLIPKLIQVKDIYPEDKEFIEKITKKSDPYITISANLSGVAEIIPNLKPDFYIGPIQGDICQQYNIKQLTFSKTTNYLGFELLNHLIEVFESRIEKEV